MRHSLFRLLAASSLLLVMAQAETRPRYGGTLRVELRGSWQSSVGALVFENLTTVDETGAPQPQLATLWEAQNSDRRWQFWLRRNVRFHDGTPLTAAAVVASLTSGECETCPWTAVRGVGDSVVFEFAAARPQFAAEMALRRYAIQHVAPDGKGVGTGPFRLGDAAGNAVVLEANPDYWNGRPFLDRIEVVENRPEREQLLDFDVGRADVIEAGADATRRLRAAATVRTQSSQPAELIALVVRTNKAALQDVRLRQAIALSLDRAALHNVVLQKEGEVAGGLLPNWMTGYAFLLPHARDLGRAQQLVRETGRPAPLTIAAETADPALRLIAERIALNAADAGIPLTVTADKSAADLVVVRWVLESTNPGVALNEMASRFTMLPSLRDCCDSPQKLYDAERALLASYTAVPLVYVPRTFALARRIRNWRDAASGRPRLEDVWLGGEPSPQRTQGMQINPRPSENRARTGHPQREKRGMGNGERGTGIMSFRRKLLLAMALTVFLAVGAVTWIVLLRTRAAFERADAERTATVAAQFQREFARRGDEVVKRIDAVARSESVSRMALDLSRGGDVATYVTEAAPIAQAQQLDFLELVAADGSIVSSAQWPARFGYKEVLPSPEPAGAFLKLETTPDGVMLGLFAIRTVGTGDKPLYVLGGERVGRDFLASLALPAGTRALLYRNVEAGFAPQSLIGAEGAVPSPERLAALILLTLQRAQDTDVLVHWSGNPADSESFHAIPLKSDTGALVGVLLLGSSRRGFVELQHHIRAVGFVVGGIGIIVAILLSGWVAARVTRPIEQLAAGAREVAAGNWNTEVQVASHDEIGEAAAAFNRMTRELQEQRARLLQAERVAAWRELARRLAHELKNPLFPLQITVENLLRARDTEIFDEVFRESTATLLAELSNLKAIIGRFSDFSKMPQPQLQPVQINDVARQVVATHEAQFHAAGTAAIEARLELDPALPLVDADPELLHRVLSNLVLNAMDAMPQGGTITVRTRDLPERVRLEIADTGSGLTKEECERLFTPYYTTKQHGTGLGLAIVQSVVSDHQGSIAVESAPGEGATFVIELPKREKALAADQRR